MQICKVKVRENVIFKSNFNVKNYFMHFNANFIYIIYFTSI